jgi:hypothetical protein
MFRSYFVICVLNLIVSALMWPDQPLNFEDQMKALHGDECDESSILSEIHLTPSVRRLPSTMLFFTKEELLNPNGNMLKKNNYGTELESTEPKVKIDRKKVEDFYVDDFDNDEREEVGTSLDETMPPSPRRLPKALELISFGLAHEVAHFTQTETNCCLDEGDILEPMAQSLSQQVIHLKLFA